MTSKGSDQLESSSVSSQQAGAQPPQDNSSDFNLESPAPSLNSISQRTAPLGAQSTKNMVPVTPGTDLSIPVLSATQQQCFAIPHLPLKGTPSTFRALCIHGPVSSQLAAWTPLQNSYVGATPRVLCTPLGSDTNILGKQLPSLVST